MKRYCANGHDTLITGRYKTRGCIACHRLATKRKASVFLPAMPLRNRLRREMVTGSARNLALRYSQRIGVSLETAERGLNRTLSQRNPRIREETADRWCVVLGIHPIELWPEEWPLEMAE